MNFEIGQIFEGEYPPEAAMWCTTHGDRWIEEIEAVDGLRRFQIVKAPEPTDADIAERVRAKRYRRLAETDWYMMPDYPADPETLELVKSYRKALRDITLQSGFPRDVEWPVMPKVFSGNTERPTSLGLAKVGLP